MEYQQKKTEILSKVQFNNLLSFSLVQNKLERNFRSIVEALMLNQAKTDTLNEDHIQTKQQHSKQLKNVNDKLQQIKKELQNFKNNNQNGNNTLPSVSNLSKQSTHQIQKLSDKKLPSKQFITHENENIDILKLSDQIAKQIKPIQNNWNDQKNNLLKQIENLKSKIHTVGYLQGEFNNFKIDLRIVKQELSSNLKNMNSKSSRNLIKRQSILNMAAKNTQRNIQKSKNQLGQTSKNSLKILNSDENKQNKQSNPNRLSQQGQDNIQNVINQNMQKQINSLYIQLNTLKISFQQLRDMFSDNKKQVYKTNALLSEVKDDLSRQIKTRKNQNQQTQKAIKDIRLQLLNTQSLQNSQNNQSEEKSLRQTTKSTKGGKKDDQDGNMNYKNQLNDKMSRMQAMIQNFITQSQFNRFKNDVNEQLQKLGAKQQSTSLNIQNLEKKLEDLIYQNQLNTNDSLSDLKNNITLLAQNFNNQNSQNQRKHNISLAKIQQLKKSLQNLREDMQFYQSMMTQNQSPKIQKKSEQIQNQTVNQNKQKSPPGFDQKSLQALKRYFNSKMHDMRTNLLGLIRDLQKKLNGKSNGQNQIIKIWDKLNQLNLFINKKADNEDAKKTFQYLEKKISRLSSVLFKNQESTQDARIARTNNWSCLSCDKNLQTYQGKIGRHVVWDSMPLKGINKSVTNLQEDKKKGLPQLKK